MNYASVRYNDVANGAGIRTTIFVSGCTHYCQGCFNSALWDFAHGEHLSTLIVNQILTNGKREAINGLSILGGEPLDQDYQELSHFMQQWKYETGKNIWLWTGYTYEELLHNAECHKVLSLVDVLVDGKFIEELKSTQLKWRGSSNQRLIDLPKTFATGSVVLMAE